MTHLTVLLDNQQMTVDFRDNSLRVVCPSRKTEYIPIGLIDQVVVYGSPRVSCNVWRKLSENHIGAVLFPGRGKGDCAWLGNGISGSVMARLHQHSTYVDEKKSLQIVTSLVESKIQSYRRLANHISSNKEIIALELEQGRFASVMETMSSCLGQLAGAENIDSLRGYEGGAAKAWFNFLAHILPVNLRFNGRNRRPPRDPVNALLSLSYTMLMSDARRTVEQHGYDPAVGFLHSPRPGRESFTLDLMEPLRSGADLFVLKLVSESIKTEHFSYSHKNGCRLNKAGRNIYYRAWSEWRKSWPAWLLDMAGSSEQNVSWCCRHILHEIVNVKSYGRDYLKRIELA